MNRQKVSKNVKLAVQIAGTQKELARLAGISQGAVSKYCRQACVPSGVTARRLSKAVSGKLKPADFAPHIFGNLYEE
jgi:DNA-binding transcriptional regulator YdaS (Cro superfamily)